VNNSQGEGVFASLNTTDATYEAGRKKGNYRSVVTVYGSLLNNGKFHITLNGYSAGWSNHFPVSNVLSFEMLDDALLKKDYKQNFGGFFRPRLNWETVKS
jgi:hypothetical protein